MADRSWDLPALALPAAIGVLAYGAMVVVDRTTGTLRAGTTSTTIGLYLLAFVGYVGAVLVSERAGTGAELRLLWLAPIIFRLLLLATEPTLSDDVYRYLWDGHVLSQGINPYSYAISASELDHVAIPIRELANNPDLSSPYLPTTQVLFAFLAFVAPSDPLVMQVVMVGFDLGAALLIRRLLVAADLPANRVVLYLWNPLVIVEAAHGAHFDALMTALTLGAVLTAVRPAVRGGGSAWRVASPVLLAAATLTRPIPLLLVPLLWWRWTWTQRLIFGGVLVAALVPFGFGVGGWGLVNPSTGTGVFGSARVYSTEFRFNAVLATWLERLAGDPDAYSALVAVLMSTVLLWVWVVAKRAAPTAETIRTSAVEVRRIMRLAMAPLAAYVVLTPVLHPWYLVAVIAFGLFLAPGEMESWRGWLAVGSLLYLTAMVSFSYLTYQDPNGFRELDWVRGLQWYPLIAYVFLALGLLAYRRLSGYGWTRNL